MVQLGDWDAKDLSLQMDEANIASVEGFLTARELREAQALSSARLRAAGGNYDMVVGPSELRSTVLGTIGEEPRFLALVRQLYALKTKRDAPDAPFYQVLRTLGPKAEREHSLKFHFDSFVVTALVPIEMPEEGGELIVARTRRSVRSTYARNLFDKICVDNALSQAAFRALYRTRGVDVFRRVALKPGNLYLFWGYCVLHTNEACPEGALRTTALWHFGDPHIDSPLKRRLRRGVGA